MASCCAKPSSGASCGPSTGSCCPPTQKVTDGVKMDAASTIKEVEKYYGETLKSTSDLKTSACCATGTVSPVIKEILSSVPDEVMERFYGCGAPLPFGIDGMRVLDLGSGSGRDSYVAAALVGPKGFVTGIDMTESQLDVARRNANAWAAHLGYPTPNMRFIKGKIEDLSSAGIADGSVDLIISNCVINLSPDKRAVLKEAFRVLADGGEFHFSDVYADRRLADNLRTDPVLLGECLGGALYIEDFKRLCHEVGFLSPRFLAASPIKITNPSIAAVLGEATFESVTFRLFKLPPGRLETTAEDYGQWAVYKGTIPKCPHTYDLDAGHRFEKGRPMLVCGNTGALVGETWLAPHFEFHGDRSVHFGLFNCKTGSGAGGGVTASLSCC